MANPSSATHVRDALLGRIADPSEKRLAIALNVTLRLSVAP
jgi:hypothetical protein